MKALSLLGIADCFQQIICFETMNPNLFNSKSSSPQEFPVILKPSLDAINIAIDVAEVDPSRTVSIILCLLTNNQPICFKPLNDRYSNQGNVNLWYKVTHGSLSNTYYNSFMLHSKYNGM